MTYETRAVGRDLLARSDSVALAHNRGGWEEMTEEEMKAIRRTACDIYADDECQIDDDAAISEADDGAWVAAWLWVPAEEEDTES